MKELEIIRNGGEQMRIGADDGRCWEVHFFCDVPEIDRALAVQDERRTVFIGGQTIILH